MRYIGRRLLRAVLLLLGVSVLCFVFSEMAPGNFFDEMRLNPQISPETIALLKSRYGLEQPLPVRYLHWLKSAAHADFGYSVAYNTAVAPLLWQRAKNTLLLTGVGLILTWIISLPLGVWTASRRDRLLDRIVTFTSAFFNSIPEVVIAIALLAVVVRWRILPVGGMSAVDGEGLSGWARFVDLARRMVVPVGILVIVESAIIVRHIRGSVADALAEPFAQAARGLGIPQRRLLFRHVLPVAASPAISLLGFSLAGLVSGSLLIEVICGWPGLGPLLLEATLSRDFDVVIGGMLLSAGFMVVGSLIADILLLACDPRIRTEAADGH